MQHPELGNALFQAIRRAFDGTLQVIDFLGDLSCLGFILEIAWFWCGMAFMVTLRYHQLGGGNIAGNGGCKFARPEIVF